MQPPRSQPTPPPPLPRPKRVVPAASRRPAAAAVRRHAFAIPDVREIPRRAVAGPWEAGW
jgi:hypothetical protein